MPAATKTRRWNERRGIDRSDRTMAWMMGAPPTRWNHRADAARSLDDAGLSARQAATDPDGGRWYADNASGLAILGIFDASSPSRRSMRRDQYTSEGRISTAPP